MDRPYNPKVSSDIFGRVVNKLIGNILYDLFGLAEEGSTSFGLGTKYQLQFMPARSTAATAEKKLVVAQVFSQ